MGPRPFGRGRCIPAITKKCSSTLQWGRDLSVAEGPRGGCRVKLTTPASMGPRPFGRGRRTGAAAIANSCSRFNGAATFRSRKAALDARPARANARASMGPRPFGRGRFRPLPAAPAVLRASMGPRPFGRGRPGAGCGRRPGAGLQWGRDLSVAEGGPERARHRSINQLQWGRDLSVAEGGARPLMKLPTFQLQWGRDLSVAEGGSRGPRDTRGRNRASMGPRPFGRGRRLTAISRRLPGSRFNGAATFRSRKDLGGGDPGHDGLGLQWGRDLSVAEGAQNCPLYRLSSCFNGAATFRSRKAGWGPRCGQGGCRASMGPRPFGRGRLECRLA